MREADPTPLTGSGVPTEADLTSPRGKCSAATRPPATRLLHHSSNLGHHGGSGPTGPDNIDPIRRIWLKPSQWVQLQLT